MTDAAAVARSTARLVAVALAASVVAGGAGFVAAAMTGSVAVLAAAVQSAVAAASQGLMLASLRRARKGAAADDFVFWSEIAAVLLFGLGAGIAIGVGAVRIGGPAQLASPGVGYGVLAAIVVAPGWLLSNVNAARRAVDAGGPDDLDRASAWPATFLAVLRLECIAGVLGGAIAAIALFVSTALDVAVADAIGTVAEGFGMAGAAARAGLGVRRRIMGGSRAPEIASVAASKIGAAVEGTAGAEVRHASVAARENYPPSRPGKKSKHRRR